MLHIPMYVCIDFTYDRRSVHPCSSAVQALISPGAAADLAVQAARALGYWGHPPAARLAALLELCRDALDCWQLRWGVRV
jgi:hypothetical protein